MVEKRDDIYKNSGLYKYGDVKFADEVNKKYPIDTPEHIRAAWSYIHMPRNFEKYSPKDIKSIQNKIVKAWKEQIALEGPPESFHSS